MFRRRPRLLLICAAVAVLATGLYAFALYSSVQRTRADVEGLKQVTDGIGALSLAQMETYARLDEEFGRVRKSTTLTLRLMTPLRGLSWVPGVGGKISEGVRYLEVARLAAAAGEDLAGAFRQALAASGDAADSPDLAAAQALGRAIDPLNSAQTKLANLRDRAKAGGLPEGYAGVFDDFMPLAEAVVFLARTQPDTMGNIMVLAKDVQTVSEQAADPINVLSDPASLRALLTALEQRSAAITHDLDQGISAARATDLPGVEGTLVGMQQDLRTLNLVAGGLRGLADVGEAATAQGMFSEQFAETARVNLPKARDSLRMAQRQLQATSGSTMRIANRSPGRQTGLSFDAMADQIDSAVSLVDFLWSFFGFDGPKTYLFLGQNQGEMRATGGFLGVVVEIGIDRGRMTSMRYLDSTRVDPQPLLTDPPAPQGLYWYLWMDRMLFRDSNWNPDYPSAAATIAALYKTTQGVQVDGVITGSKRLMVDLLDIFGDVRVPGIDGVLTRELADYYTEENGSGYPCTAKHSVNRAKRCFDEDLFNVLWERLHAGVSESTSKALILLLKGDLDRKDILIHLFDPQAAELLWSQGWNGAITRTDGDYLMVVDSSLPGHSSPVMSRQFEYRVTLSPEQPVAAQLRVHYRNAAPPSGVVCRQADWELLSCYWNYVRVLLPGDATVTAPPVLLHEGSEKLAWGYADTDTLTVTKGEEVGLRGLTQVGAYLVVEPSTTLSFPITYELPPKTLKRVVQDTWEYRLLVQKQPGMAADRVAVQVALPPGSVLVEAKPTPNTLEDHVLRYSFTLVRDQEMSVTFRSK